MSFALTCHKKDENVIQLFGDTLLDAFPGLATSIKILGADGENSILSRTCNTLSYTMLLLCVKPFEENIIEIFEMIKYLKGNIWNIIKRVFDRL